MKTRKRTSIKLKKIIFSLIGLFLAFSIFAQEDPEEFTMAARWSPGDTFFFKITNMVEQWIGNDLVEDDTSIYYTDLIILDSTEHGYRIRWEYINNLSAFGLPEDQWDDFHDFEYQEVICQTDANGALVRIENLAELRNETFAITEASLKQKLATKKIDLEQYKKSIERFKKFYYGEIGAKSLEDDFISHTLHHFGKSFQTNQKVRSNGLTDNPFGGDPITADTETVVELPTQNRTQLRIVTKSHLNEDAVHKLMIEVLQKIELVEEQLEQELAKMQCKIDQKSIYDFDHQLSIGTNIISTAETKITVMGETMEAYSSDRIELIDFRPNRVKRDSY